MQGLAKFTRSGTAVISATFNSVVVNVPGGLTATSHVLATMQTHLASGTPRVLAAVPNPANGRITICLDAPVPSMKTVTIAWFVFGSRRSTRPRMDHDQGECEWAAGRTTMVTTQAGAAGWITAFHILAACLAAR